MRLRLSASPAFESPAGTVPLAPRDAAILAWLAVEGPTPRARLARLFWPDHGEEAARGSLRQRLFQLRRQAGCELVTGGPTLALADGLAHDLHDADRLLEDDAPAIGGEFDHWLAAERDRRRHARRQQQRQAIEAAERAGDLAGALAQALAWRHAEPQLEEAHRAVVRLHYLAGDRGAALDAYRLCEAVLQEALGVVPDAETRSLLALLREAERPAPAPLAALPVGVLRPPRLVGRSAEIHAAAQARAAGCVVALVGEAGIGKSRLLRHVLPAGRAVQVAARPGDAGVPLATLARLVRAVTADAPLRPLPPAVRRELARALPEWAEVPTAGEGERLLLHRALRRLLAAAPGLAAVAVDDLHFADAASLELLGAVLDADDPDVADDGGGPGSPAAPCWLLAYRPAEAGSALAALQQSLAEQARLARVAVQPLDLAALAELVDSLGIPGLDGARLAPGLLERSGGNPLFALETLKQAWFDGGLAQLGEWGTTKPGNLPRPAAVMELIGRRLAQLSPTALALARCAAVAGQAFSPALAERVLATPALALADAWAELEAARILRDHSFEHDLYLEAALASVPRAIARHLHVQIARALDADAAVAPATLAQHWLAAGEPARAAPHLERAARDAGARLAPADAARLWLRLAEVHADGGDRDAERAATVQAVLALRAATSGPELAALLDRLAGLADDVPRRAQVAEMRAAMWVARGDPQQGMATLTEALAEIGDDAPAAARSTLLNIRGVLQRRCGDGAGARRTLEAALALARADPAGDLPAVLNNLALVLQEADEHVAAVGLLQEAASKQPDPLVRARVQNNLAISLEEQGQAALAYEQRLAAARAVGGCGAALELTLAVSLGGNAVTLARYADALRHLRRGSELIESERSVRADDLHRHFAALWLDLGRPNLAREALAQAERLRPGPYPAALATALQVRLLLQQRGLGDAVRAEALALLGPAEAALVQVGAERALRRLRVLKARCQPPEVALAGLRELAAAPALRDNVAALLPVQLRMAQALLALGDAAAALRHAERAADWLRAVTPPEVKPAEVQCTLAEAALAAGERALARDAALAGRDWVLRVAAEQLDELYREGWLHRNPANAAVLALAARLAA